MDAIDPDTLREMCERCIRDHIDQERMKRTLAVEAAEARRYQISRGNTTRTTNNIESKTTKARLEWHPSRANAVSAAKLLVT